MLQQDRRVVTVDNGLIPYTYLYKVLFVLTTRLMSYLRALKAQ